MEFHPASSRVATITAGTDVELNVIRCDPLVEKAECLVTLPWHACVGHHNEYQGGAVCVATGIGLFEESPTHLHQWFDIFT